MAKVEAAGYFRFLTTSSALNGRRYCAAIGGSWSKRAKLPGRGGCKQMVWREILFK